MQDGQQFEEVPPDYSSTHETDAYKIGTNPPYGGERRHDEIADRTPVYEEPSLDELASRIPPYSEYQEGYRRREYPTYTPRVNRRSNTAWIFALVMIVVLILSGVSYAFTHQAPSPQHSVTHQTNQQQPTAPANVESLVGQWAYVPKNQPVTLIDGGSCWVSFGGKDTVVTDDGSDKVIVSYSPPSEPGAPGVFGCPINAKYPVARSAFETMNGEYKANYDAIKRDQQYVANILKRNYRGPLIPAGNGRFVTSVNLEQLERSFDHTTVQYGDSCQIGISPDASTQGGWLQERGKAPDGRILYEYIVDGDTHGTECPKGTLFFENTQIGG